MILVRKALLQLISRFTTTRPYLQGCIALSVYFPVLIMQSRVSLALEVKVILMPPCIFCIDNH